MHSPPTLPRPSASSAVTFSAESYVTTSDPRGGSNTSRETLSEKYRFVWAFYFSFLILFLFYHLTLLIFKNVFLIVNFLTVSSCLIFDDIYLTT